MKLRSPLALFLAVALAAVAASSALATTPRDDGEAVDVTPGVAAQQSVARTAAAAPNVGCSSGARTLSHFGDRLYPEMGNGGYRSVHTDVYISYDAVTGLFLAGTHVDHTDLATQCLTDFSLDFERTNANTSGPNMTVASVLVNGQPAAFEFKQPTYPGDPNGQDDPDPAAHAVSNVNPVSATNPNPPACSPQTNGNTQNGTQCPANKLVITPAAPIAEGASFVVTVNYTGRPGVHVDGDGSTEGWFRIATALNEGSFVTTEPVGTASWLPLNNHPSAKPTYDVYDTVNAGKVAIGPGELVGATIGATFAPVAPTTMNPPDANFAGGSWLWHWHSPEPIASYLVENSIGSYDLTARIGAGGIQYYQAQGSSITAARKAINKIAMDNQEDIMTFQALFNGPYPFTTAGVVVGVANASFEEEMQTKITFAGGQIGGTAGTSLGTFNHESMHQWFGDNVAEASFNMTFWKEGFATLGEYLSTARGAATAAGGMGTPAGDTAFENSLISRFNTNYNTTSSTFWTSAPSNPTVGNLFSTASTYTRPGTAYLALWRILGRDRMIGAMKKIQSDYGGGNITEPQLEAEFHQALPNQSASCHARLDQFFTQWFDTAYPAGGGANKPQITGPGLNGPGFACAPPTIEYTLTPPAPTGNAGWYTGDVALAWHVDNGIDATTTTTGCVDRIFTTDGTFSESCSATNTIGSAGPVVVNVKRDATAAETTASLEPTPIGAWYSPRTVTLSAHDGTSGVASTSYRVDGGPWTAYSGPFFVGTYGPHTLEYRSTDVAGNLEATKTTSWGADFPAADQLAGLYDFVGGLGLDKGLTKDLQHRLSEAGKKLDRPAQACDQLDEFLKQVMDQAGKKDPRLTFAQAEQLLSANQIEALLGCIPVDSTRLAAESKVLALMQTIDGLDVAKPVADDLGNRAREIGKQIAVGDRHACQSLAELSKKVAELRTKGKLSAAQAAELDAAVAGIEDDVGC